jgi:hypothetical protein
MTTPSMSPLIPVGALMATQQATFPLHIGEIVAFKPPGMGGTVFAHKIYSISYSHGQVLYRTKGVLNSSADPWVISRGDVVGKVVWWGDGVGWLLKCLPWFTVSLVAIYSFLRWLRVMDSVAFFAAVDLALYVTLIVVNPLVHLQLLALVENNHHSASAWIVNTGLLDVRLHYNGATHLLRAGHVTAFTAVGKNIIRNGRIYIPGRSALRWWQLIIEIALISGPIIAIVVSKFFKRASAEELAEWEAKRHVVEPAAAAAATAAAPSAGGQLQPAGTSPLAVGEGREEPVPVPVPVPLPVPGSRQSMLEVLRSVAGINDDEGRGVNDEEIRQIARRAGMDPRGMSGYYGAKLLEKRSDGSRWLGPKGRDRFDGLVSLSALLILEPTDLPHADLADLPVKAKT